MSTDGEPRALSHLLPLMAWLSPTYPVGAYAYSHSLEWAAEMDGIRDVDTLTAWIADTLELGAGRTDAILFAHAHAAAACGSMQQLCDINELALALAPSAELHLETSQQGRSFLDATLKAWPLPGFDDMPGEIAYPVAVALTAATHGIPLKDALPAYLFGFAQNLVSAAIRLSITGQTGGTQVLAALTPRLATLAEEAENSTLDDIGSATFRADFGSLLHETQYTRLFRS